MRLTLVRHTSVAAPKGICYGKTDVPLASTFRAEMEQIRQEIDAENFDAVFSSPLSRCTRLAAEVCAGRLVTFDERLRELDFGDWEMADWNSVFASQEGKEWFADYVNTRCPNGESFADQIARMRSFLAATRAANYSNILVFTHAGSLRATMCLLQDKTPEEAFNTPLDYGQILTFTPETL